MSNYWEDRALSVETESQLIASRYYSKLEERVKEAQQNIIDQINQFYITYAKDTGMTMSEAKKLLTSKERQQFLEVDLARFREMSLSGNPAYDKLLDEISYRVRISRYEALLTRLELETIALYGAPMGIQEYVYTGLMEVYQNSYYKLAYDFAVAVSSMKPVAIISEEALKQAASYNWSGKEFSQRIWSHQAETVTRVNTILEQSFTSGQSYNNIAKRLMETYDVSAHRAKTLVRTESNFFHNLATLDSYEDADIEKYQLLAVLDMRTTQICSTMDGKIFPMDQYKVGVTAPPFHPNCRTTTIPHFEDERLTTGEMRSSMKGNVDAHLSYEQWYEKYITPADELEAKKQKARYKDREQLKRYQEALGRKGSLKSMKAFQQMKYENPSDWDAMKTAYRKRKK